MTTDNKIESYTRIEVRSADFPALQQWAAAHQMELNSIGHHDKGTEPKLIKEKQLYTNFHAMRVQDGLNAIADHLQPMQLSTITRQFLNSSLTQCHANLFSLEDLLACSEKTVTQLRALPQGTDDTCPSKQNPLCLGACDPRLSLSRKELTHPPALRIQEALNDLSGFLESSVTMSAKARDRYNLERTVISDMLQSLDTALTGCYNLKEHYRKQIEEAGDVTILIENPSLLTRQGDAVFDTLQALANALDNCYELTDESRTTINAHLAECIDSLEDMDIDLDYAESTSNTADEECEQARDEADEARTTIDEAADRFDRAPHLIDDLEDYAAHLRHTSADRKAIALMELAVSTLKTIRTLLS